MIIYKKDNSVRLQVHQSADSEMIQEISGEEYVLFKFESNVFTTFEVGDYITVYGQTFTLKKVVAPIEKSGTNRFGYTLNFKSNRDDLGEVSFQLFDNTTISVVPAYNPSTTYSQGDVVSYHTLHWKYISPTPTSGNAPAENEYWAIKSTITSYVPPYNSATTYTYADTVDYNNNYFMHIGAVDTVGVSPVEGDHWTVVKTAPMWDFSTILTPTRYAQLIVDNMNRARPNQTWTVGYCIPAEPKESTFSNAKCLDAASSIAELFETEFWVDGYSVNFGKRSNATSITMQFGKGGGFTKVVRNEVTESRKVTRLIALGAERNLLGTYRNGSKRLMLPNKYYLDADNIDLSSPLEDTQTWDDVYPCMQHATEDYDPTKTYYAGNQVLYNDYSWDCIATATGVTPTEGAYWKYSEGTVTTSVSQYKLIDKNLTFDPLDMQYRMTDGTMPKVKFFTGNLAGYEFPITGYNNTTKQITIEQISDGTNSLLPTASYGFKLGDRFGFVDLYMPASYVAKAEQRLLAKAQEYLEKYSKDQISYSGDVDEIWATNGHIELHIGDVIHFVDADFNISLDYRIIKVTRNLTRQYKYSIELSTLPYMPSKITSITNKVTQNETYIEYNGLNTKMSKSKTFLGAREAIDMAFDPSGSYFTDKIKPLIVETSALLVGTEQQQYQVTDLSFKTYASNPNLIEWLAGTLIDSSVEESERTWSIVSGSFTATDDNQAYYCYIRCVRTSGSTSAIVLFDTVQHLTEEGNDYYYFLLGSLSSVKNGMRQLYTSKGFTFINGDTIVTGTIQSESGETYLDLKNGITHIGSTEKYIDWRNGQLKIKGTLTVSPSGAEFPIPCYRGVYSRYINYFKGDVVQHRGSTWISIYDRPFTNVEPEIGSLFWEIYAQKGGDGDIGVGLFSIVERYLASSASSGVTINTPGWTTDVQTVTNTEKYLWNYETITYTDFSKSNTEPAIIGVYGDTGVGISGINEYYLATPMGSGVTKNTPGWTGGVQEIDALNKYLWNYERISYTDENYTETEPIIIAMYSKDGEPGVPGNYFEHRYAVNGSKTVPPGIVATQAEPIGWTVTLPTQGLMQYMWFTTAEKTSAGALVSNWSNPQRLTGIEGEKGDVGAAQSYYGEWSASYPYVGNNLVVSVVKYNSVYYIARTDVGVIPIGTLPTNTAYWNVYGTSFESVATGLLLAQNAWIENLIVSRLGTSANPYKDRFATVGSGIGIFKTMAEEGDMDKAIVKIGKDISISHSSGQKKPCIGVRDVQWMGEYNNETTYYKDDRVYYSANNNAQSYNSSLSYYIGNYVRYGFTIWRCYTNCPPSNIPYVGSPYWAQDGRTYLFVKEWLESETPTSGFLPTNLNYWHESTSGNSLGGQYSELGSEGVYSNGSNMSGFLPGFGLKGAASVFGALQRRINDSDAVTAGVIGFDQTDISNGISKSYGGWFNSLYAGRFVRKLRKITESGVIGKDDCIIHCYNSGVINLGLPTPDKSMIGQEIRVRMMGNNRVTMYTDAQYPIWHRSSITYIDIAEDNMMSFIWDGTYWVTIYTDQ